MSGGYWPVFTGVAQVHS